MDRSQTEYVLRYLAWLLDYRQEFPGMLPEGLWRGAWEEVMALVRQADRAPPVRKRKPVVGALRPREWSVLLEIQKAGRVGVTGAEIARRMGYRGASVVYGVLRRLRSAEYVRVEDVSDVTIPGSFQRLYWLSEMGRSALALRPVPYALGSVWVEYQTHELVGSSETCARCGTSGAGLLRPCRVRQRGGPVAHEAD